MNIYEVVFNEDYSPVIIKADYAEIYDEAVRFYSHVENEEDDERVASFSEYLYFVKVGAVQEEKPKQEPEDSEEDECVGCKVTEEIEKFIKGFAYKTKEKK